jgi:hypothetical protein
LSRDLASFRQARSRGCRRRLSILAAWNEAPRRRVLAAGGAVVGTVAWSLLPGDRRYRTSGEVLVEGTSITVR